MRLVVASVSTATRLCGSWPRNKSTIASEIRSHTLSGWPSPTDSEVKREGSRCWESREFNMRNRNDFQSLNAGLRLAAPNALFRTARHRFYQVVDFAALL